MERHHRINVELSCPAPFIDDVAKIESMDQQATDFLETLESRQQLQRTAQALIAALFYPVLSVFDTISPGIYSFKGRIECRLERQYQHSLLKRLEGLGSSFLINNKRQEIDFSTQKARINQGNSFQQEVWGSFQRDGFVHIYLSLRHDLPSDEGRDSKLSPTPNSRYPISHSPCHVSPAFGFSVS
jgi:hypothetical protein